MSFLNEYTLLGELGQGGFAKVYKVRHNELGYIRAIRILNEPIIDEKDSAYQLFLRECKMMLRIGNGDHPNIIHVYRPRLLESHAIIEEDFVSGKNLYHYMVDNDFFVSANDVIRMAKEISSALSYCHEDIYKFCMDPEEDALMCDPYDGSKILLDEPTRQRLINKYKLIHNNINSTNIMRREDGSFVLLGFGLAIAGDEDVRRSSRHELGAVEYMAPEKWNDSSVLAEQSDIYSFGIVMYEYLAGRVPFPFPKEHNSSHAENYIFVGENHINGVPPRISDLRKAAFEAKYPGKTYQKDYPEWLEEVIMRCLEKDPSKRFRNGKELYEYICNRFDDPFFLNQIQRLEKKIDDLKKSISNLSEENETMKKLVHLLTTPDQNTTISRPNDQ